MLLGDSSVGKTCFMSTYIDGVFLGNTHYSTVGLDFKIKQLAINDTVVDLQVWDTAGQERFYSVTRSFFTSAQAIVLMFDICNEQSFHNIVKWIGDIKEHANKDVCSILVGNKNDLAANRVVQRKDAEVLADQHKLSYMECSAKTGSNIELVFETLAKMFLSKNKASKNATVTFDEKIFIATNETVPSNNCIC